MPGSPRRGPRGGGRYTLSELLGRGGMGEVRRACDERRRRHAAIKRIRPVQGREAQLRARLERGRLQAIAEARPRPAVAAPVYRELISESDDRFQITAEDVSR